jgi:DNA polymerase I-like protein with 3'-5' exonuclease and polymerase domains
MLPSEFRHTRKIDVQMKPWMDDYHFELVTPDNIDRVVDECIEAGVYGFDLETTSLDTRIFPRQTESGEIREVVTDIVGICLSPGKKRSYYLPILHRPNGKPSPHNLPFSVWDGPIRRMLRSASKPVVHNCKFEGEILSFPGGESYGDWDSLKWWEDTQILGYLDDPNRKAIGLKALSKEILDKEQIELNELFPPKTKRLDYSLLDPADPAVLAYGASDAVCTLELYHALRKRATALKSKDGNGKPHNQSFILGVEKMCVPAVRWMERARLPIDLDLAGEFIKKARIELIESLKELYAGASEILGRDITPLAFYLVCQELENNEDWKNLDVSEDPNAPTLRALFDACKKEAGRVQRAFDKGDLRILKDCDDDPALEALLNREAPPPRTFGKDTIKLKVEYDVMSAAQLGVLLFDLGVKGLQKTDTGQIKTSKDVLDEVIEANQDTLPFMKQVKVFRGNDQALKNLVNIWRDTDRRDNSLRISFRAYAAGTGRFSSKGDRDPEATGGTKFNLQSMPNGKDPRSPEALLRIRECIRARDGKVMVVIDFSGVELRIVANVAREKKWIDQFFKCSDCNLTFPRDSIPPKFCPRCGSDKIGDIHTLTAIQVYGADAPSKPEWKVYRGRGKNTNFALNYGGGPKAIQRQTGCTRNEAHRIYKMFKSSYDYLTRWQKRTQAFARKYGYVLTAFNRKYTCPDITHDVQWIRGKAERNAINSPIQGTSADITKMAMGLVYHECKKRGWLDKVHMILTMHDELVFEVDEDILEEATDMFVEVMTNNSAIRARKWPVPLTVDVELGMTWKAKYNLDAIKYEIRLRRLLQRPGLKDDEIRGLLRCVDGFYGGRKKVKARFNSFEDIQWPEMLRPHFAMGREEKPFTAEEKAALARAWAMYFDGEVPEKVAAPAETPVEGSQQQQASATEHEPEPVNGKPQPFGYKLQTLSVGTAIALSELLVECNGSGDHQLILLGPDGTRLRQWNWTDSEVMVDPDVFTRKAQERNV